MLKTAKSPWLARSIWVCPTASGCSTRQDHFVTTNCRRSNPSPLRFIRRFVPFVHRAIGGEARLTVHNRQAMPMLIFLEMNPEKARPTSRSTY